METQLLNIVKTSVPTWETECEEHVRLNVPFEIRGVYSEQQRRHVLNFALKHRWTLRQGDGMARLYPPGVRAQ